MDATDEHSEVQALTVQSPVTMADVARDQLDHDIAYSIWAAQMCDYLATVAGSAPAKRGNTKPEDAEEALLYAAKLCLAQRENLEHVRAIYDSWVHGVADG